MSWNGNDIQFLSIIDRVKRLEVSTLKKALGKYVTNEPNLTERVVALEDKVGLEVTPNVYEVGENKRFITITEAVNQWVTDGKPLAEVYISKGTYIESINVGANANISFIGKNKYNTILKNNGGYYAYSPLTGFGGENGLHIKNMTIIATHDDVVGYEYLPLSTPDTPLTAKGGSYCVHSDLPTTGKGLVTVENCIMINYQNACLGFETNKDQKIIIKNSEFYSYAETDDNGGNIEARDNGAILFQTANNSQGSGQKLIMIDNYIYSKNGKAMLLTSYDADGIDCLFVNNILKSDFYTKKADLIKTAEAVGAPFKTCFRIDYSSHGNTSSLLNRYTEEVSINNNYGDNLYDYMAQSLTYGISNASGSIIINGIRLTPVVMNGNVYLGNIGSYNASQYYMDVEYGKSYLITFESNIPKSQILIGEFEDTTWIEYQLVIDGEQKSYLYTPKNLNCNKIALRFGWTYNNSANSSVTVGDYTNIRVKEILEEKETITNEMLFTLLEAIKTFSTTIVGTTVKRPINASIGQLYFDTTLGLPIWFDGTGWVKADGTDADL